MSAHSARILVPAAASAAVALVVVLTTVARPSPDSTVVTSPGQPSNASDELHARADAVFESFNGTVHQRNASGVLQAWSLNGAFDECMESVGFPEWDWSATRNAAPRTNSMDSSLFFAAPLAHSYSNALMDTADSLRAEEALRTDVLTPQETDAVSRCANETPATSDETASVASTPEVVASLRNEWWSMLAQLDKRFGQVAAYNACFADKAAALAVTETIGDSWKGAISRFAPPPAETPNDLASPLTRGAAWERFLEAEASIEQVDWDCRRTTYSDHLDEVDAAIKQFASEHASAIESAQEAWIKVVSAANELGYHGQTGSIDQQRSR